MCEGLTYETYCSNLWTASWSEKDNDLGGGWGTSVGCHNGEMPPCVFVVMGVGQSHV